MTDVVRTVKEQVNIVEVIGEYVRLKKTGSGHMGLCPFHGERSPSFSVSEQKQVYHCFGCQRGGDVISFVQEIQTSSFQEALKYLVSKFSLKIPAEALAKIGGGRAASADDRLEVYYKLNRFVAQFYHEKLLSPEGRVAREYLASRSLSDATVKTAYLGFAPSGWSELYDFLVTKKAPLEKAEELGLIRRKAQADHSGREHYDLFRDRLMFPVSDSRGRVIAFGGRALGNSEGPKYLNSTESPVFKKGNHLFGLFQAQKDVRAEDQCLLVEGFVDCLSLQQSGFPNTVATLGTALTSRQIQLLKRYTTNIVVLFDGDSAGQEAQGRAIELFLDEGVVVRGVRLPDELDPDEYVKERGAENLRELVKNAPYLLDQKILELRAASQSHAEMRARAVDQILPLIAKIHSDTARLVRLQEVSQLFQVPVESLETQIRNVRGDRDVSKVAAVAASMNRPKAIAPRKQASFDKKTHFDLLDAKFLEATICFQSLISKMPVDQMLVGIENEAVRVLVSKILTENISPERLLESLTDSALRSQVSKNLITAEKVQAQMQTDENFTKDVAQDLCDLERRLVQRSLERQKDSLRAVIMKADGSGNADEFSRLLNEYNSLVRRLDESKAKIDSSVDAI